MNKRAKTSIDNALADVLKREVGELSARNFAHRFAASEDLVLRFEVDRKLEKHSGCVNTLSFSDDGDILVSGSDDRHVILWDWETGRIKLSFHSGHSNNVFQAKIMPGTDNRSIVTCGADGQVRHAQILENGRVEPVLLARHYGGAHKLAIEPGSPHIFYSCGEDGLVQHFDLRTGGATELFTCQAVNRQRRYASLIQLNAISIDPRNPNLFAVAGSDEYARLYDIRKYKWDGSSDFGRPINYFCPTHLIGDDNVGITGLAFSELSELLLSYNDENIYLFTPHMGLGSNPIPASPEPIPCDAKEVGTDDDPITSMVDSGEVVSPQVYKGHRNCETVKGVNFLGPKCEYVMSGSDCGRIFIWKKKNGELIRVMEADKHIVNCIECHPHSTVLASSGIENDIKIWIPKALERAKLPAKIEQVLKRDQYPWLMPVEVDDDDEEDDDLSDDADYYDDTDDYDEDANDCIEEDSDNESDDGVMLENVIDDFDNDKPKSRDWMYHMASPEDLMMQLFSLPRRRSSRDHEGENSDAGRQLLDLIMTFNANSDVSSDSGEDAGQEDIFTSRLLRR